MLRESLCLIAIIAVTAMGSNTVFNFGDLYTDRTIILICDVQTGFSSTKTYDEVIKTANKLISVANVLKIPVYASQHTPAKYGAIDQRVIKRNVSMVYEKNTFNMLNDVLDKKINKDVPYLKSVIIIGIEAHICVEQTIMALRQRGVQVFVIAEGISSAKDYDKIFAVERFKQYGSFVETIESLVYKLLKNTIHPQHDVIVSIIEENTST